MMHLLAFTRFLVEEKHSDVKLEKHIFYGFCGNNYLILYEKLNLSWARTAAWQASCGLPRESLRTVVLNPNCYHCSQAPGPAPAVLLTDDLTTYFTTETLGMQHPSLHSPPPFPFFPQNT